MKVEIFGFPEFHIPLTLEHVALLSKLGRDHHNIDVREFSTDGQLKLWTEHITEFRHMGSRHVPPIVARTKDLNVCLEILKDRVYDTIPDSRLASEMRSTFEQCIRLASSAMPKWHVTFKPEHENF